MGIVGWVIIGLIVLIAIYAISIYNRLVRLRALVREGFSGITVQLRRRADLVPNLVETVQGYATHERATLDEVTAHRADATRETTVQGTAQADAQFTGLLGRLMAVAEAYPDLKADENFRQLSAELSELEGELQSARRYYNATVRDLNTQVQSFPDTLFARPLGFTEEPSYEDSDTTIQTAPKVSFPAPGGVTMRRLAASLAALLWLAAAPSTASAEERITRFLSDVQVQRDASLDVTETIDVRAEGDRIRRGIFRDFPTRYRGRNGAQVRVGFTLGDVLRDGAPEKAAIEAISNGVRIRIGDAEKTLDPGDHRYMIRYRTTRQVGRFADYDELYWNVTGNSWVFSIDAAAVRIRLPAAVEFGQRAVYTGAQGSTARNATVAAERPGEIELRATAPLGPYEGLTVAVAWPKGVVAEADEGTRARWWLADYGPPLVGLLALFGLGGFYYFAWQRAGRNPKPGTVVPLFAPADDLSPAAMRYVWKMGADNRAFAAALVDLGVRGHVRLVEEAGGFFKGGERRIERLASAAPLPAAEQAMLHAIAASGESIVMEKENHAKFSAAKKALDDAFKERFEGRLFRRNWGWALAGVALFFAALWLAAAAVVAATGVLDVTQVLVALGALVTTALLSLLVQSMQTVGKCLMVIGIGVFGALALATGFPVVGAAFQSGWLVPLAFPLIGLPLVISAFFWIAAPTREGRAVLDRIAGFRQIVSIAEGERLDRLTPPRETPELFERFLPYAIALGVENRWAERFQGTLAAAAAAQGGQQGFAWYSGDSNPWDNTGDFVDSVGSSLASTVSAASTAPGSSSGSGGGGSSGGGGGGGGGGGW